MAEEGLVELKQEDYSNGTSMLFLSCYARQEICSDPIPATPITGYCFFEIKPEDMQLKKSDLARKVAETDDYAKRVIGTRRVNGFIMQTGVYEKGIPQQAAVRFYDANLSKYILEELKRKDYV